MRCRADWLCLDIIIFITFLIYTYYYYYYYDFFLCVLLVFQIGLPQLKEMFNAEHISMDVLVDMTHDSLKDIGVTAYGHRHKILRGIKDLQARIPERKKTKAGGKPPFNGSSLLLYLFSEYMFIFSALYMKCVFYSCL